MSSNNQLVILVKKKIEVHLDACVDNEFVPKQNTLIKKFDNLSTAIEFAIAYCNTKMIEYSYRLDNSCLESLSNKIDKFEKKHICMGTNVVTSEDYEKLKEYIDHFVKQISDEFMSRFYGSDITDKDYEEYLKFIDDKAGDLE